MKSTHFVIFVVIIELCIIGGFAGKHVKIPVEDDLRSQTDLTDGELILFFYHGAQRELTNTVMQDMFNTAKNYDGKLTVLMMDADKIEEPKYENIKPSLLLTKKGKLISTIVGGDLSGFQKGFSDNI